MKFKSKSRIALAIVAMLAASASNAQTVESVAAGLNVLTTEVNNLSSRVDSVITWADGWHVYTTDLANAAQSTANGAQATANTAVTAAANARAVADSAASLAGQALTTANTAQTTADTAQATANTAQFTANVAVTSAAAAQTTANSAQARADFAHVRIDGLDQRVTTAQTTANTALTNAAAAQSTANSAQARADFAHVRIDNLDLRADQHSNQLTVHNTQITNIDQRVSGTETDITSLQQQDVVHTTQIQDLYSGGANDSTARTAIEATNARIDRLEGQVAANRKEASAGIAGVAAMVAASPVSGSLKPGQTAMGVGMGSYGGQAALAMSLTRRVTNPNHPLLDSGYLKAGIAITRGKPVVSLGMNWVIR